MLGGTSTSVKLMLARSFCRPASLSCSSSLNCQFSRSCSSSLNDILNNRKFN